MLILQDVKTRRTFHKLKLINILHNLILFQNYHHVLLCSKWHYHKRDQLYKSEPAKLTRHQDSEKKPSYMENLKFWQCQYLQGRNSVSCKQHYFGNFNVMMWAQNTLDKEIWLAAMIDEPSNIATWTSINTILWHFWHFIIKVDKKRDISRPPLSTNEKIRSEICTETFWRNKDSVMEVNDS